MVREITKEELKKEYKSFMTVGELKEFISERNINDDAKILVQRVEDIYYEKHNWAVYKKGGDVYQRALLFNKDIEKNKFSSLKKVSEEELESLKDEYTPAWCCVYYNDEDNLFIDLHY